ncbi:MAG: single-stranded DNA-binding protein [Treponema sp.]|jgi:single-strand DNA-binding protein|nr:single-stranded DNA-binding protein [Treponema sp.]
MNSDLNTVIIEGNVTRLPEVKVTPSGFTICKLSIAVNRRYKNTDGTPAEDVGFFDIETFGKTADACAKYIQKGQGIRVEGSLKQHRWKDKTDHNLSRVTIEAQKVVFKPLFNHKKEQTKDDKNKELSDLTEAAEAVSQEIAGTAVF